MGALEGEVIIKDLINGVWVREGDQLLVLCHILPVIDQHRLKVIRHRQFDGRTGMEGLLL